MSTLGYAVARRRLRSALLGETAAPIQIDRFELQSELGHGGMGTVWLAHDTQLRRQVALKFLRRAAAGEQGEQRLLVEAQNLAQLSHPHVVPVFDVGQHQGRVWVAMEFVPGQTLRQWVQRVEPSPAERLAAWIDAGRGLAAVHAGGLVHCDVKPDNVLLGDDGRVRLIDFGLVKGQQEQEAIATFGEESGEAFAGTPAYASPEQLQGQSVDARSDQFSYCVSLWESLVGQRPDPELLPAHPGQRVPLPAGQRLSRRVHAALSVGLSRERAARFESMESLLAALEPRRRRWVWGIGATAGAGGLALGLLAAPTEVTADPCAQTGRPLLQRWSSERREAIAAQDQQLAVVIDGWAERWRAVALQACEEVHVEQLRSDDSLGPRRACLDDRLDALDALLQAEYSEGPRPVSWREVLDDPAPCLGPAILSMESGAAAPEKRQEVSRVRRELASARWGMDDPRLDRRRQRAAVLFEQARALDHPPLTGFASLVQGHLAWADGDLTAGQRHFGEALDVGQRVDPLLVVDAWTGLHRLVLDLELDTTRAHWVEDRLASSLSSHPRAHSRHGLATFERGRLLALEGDLAGAEAALGAAIEHYVEAGPTAAWQHAAALRQLADVLVLRGRPAEARPRLDAARELEGAPGQRPPSPRGAAAMTEALQYLAAGDVLQARKRLGEALVWLEREHGPGSLDVGNAHVALASVENQAGELDTAGAHARLADGIMTRAGHARHPDRIGSLSAVGTIAFRQRRFEIAVDAFALALEIAKAHHPPGSTALAWARVNLAEALHESGRDDEAEVLLDRAAAVLTETLGPEHPDLALPHKVRGAVALARGDLDRAYEALSSARSLMAGATEPVVDPADVEALVAEVLRAQRDRGAGRAPGP